MYFVYMNPTPYSISWRAACCALIMVCFGATVQAQAPCDPGIAPSNLEVSTSSPLGLVLTWDETPGAVAARLLVELPSGDIARKTIISPEPDAFIVPYGVLEPGTYIWRVQSGCSLVPPYDLTGFSPADTFVFGTPVTCPLDVTDIDGNVYPVVQIGPDCWMGRNLEVTHFQNGDPIPEEPGNTVWASLSTPAYSTNPNADSLTNVYGRIYNWFVVDDGRGVCPVGWHVPSNTEWVDLKDRFGGASVAGGAIKSTSSNWQAPNTAATNSSGFGAEPAGYRSASNGSFFEFRRQTIYWSSTPASSSSRALGERLYFDDDLMNTGDFLRDLGTSIRCIKD
jgi:uncharacterized protein (TIGR02145 family)